MKATTNPELQEAFKALNEGRFSEAEARSRGILRARPTDAEALHFLSLLHFDRGDDPEAIRLLTQSLHYAPTNAEVWLDLGNCLLSEGMSEPGVESVKQAIACDPKFTPAYRILAMSYYRLGLKSEASELYAAWIRELPGDIEVEHMLTAATGKNVPSRCSDAYVQTHFDKYAEIFDDALRKRLAYRGPEIVAEALASYAGPAEARLDMLDAGCGTGLCGALIRPWCRRLTGVDLAGKMVERARERGIYDELAVSELCAFMETRPASFDAIISADVLIYFGELERVMQLAHGALRPGGLIIMTTEALSGDGDVPYRLEVSGRYNHHERYLRKVLEEAGFVLLHLGEQSLRMEMGQSVVGHVIVAGKRPAQ